MSALFISKLADTDLALSARADVLIDTNVMLETLSVGDLLREGQRTGGRVADWLLHAWLSSNQHYGPDANEAALRSTAFHYRLRRAKYSTLLPWVLCERQIVGGMLGNEVLDKLLLLTPTTNSLICPLLTDGTTYAITTGIVNVIRPMLISRGLKLGSLTEVKHEAIGDRADDELFALAQRDHLPIVTNEGLTEGGITERKKNKKLNLRGRCRQEMIQVNTPEEYLAKLNINITDASTKFLKACETPVLLAYIRSQRGTAYSDMLEDLVPLYRLILLGEVRDDLRHITPPRRNSIEAKPS